MDKVKLSGLLVMLFGIACILVSVFVTLYLLIYGVPIFIVGLIIFFNKKEDKIEEINYKKGGINEKNGRNNRYNR